LAALRRDEGLIVHVLLGFLERAGKTTAQTLASGLMTLTPAMLSTFAPLRNAFVIAVSAGVLSLITAFGAIKVSKKLGYLSNSLLRSALTFAQTVAATAGASKPFNLLQFRWPQAIAIAGIAALASLLTSLASTNVGDPGSPSLVKGVR
jgi:hypothetical protein